MRTWGFKTMQDDFLLSWCTNEQQFLLSQKRNEDEKCVCMTANTQRYWRSPAPENFHFISSINFSSESYFLCLFLIYDWFDQIKLRKLLNAWGGGIYFSEEKNLEAFFFFLLRSIKTLICACPPLPGLNSLDHITIAFSTNMLVLPMKRKVLILFTSMASYIWCFSASIPFRA